MKRQANEKSILKMLTSNLEDGALKTDYVLPEDENIPADDAEISDEQKAMIDEAIKDASEGYIEGGASSLRELSKVLPAAAAREYLQEQIAENQDGLNMQMLVRLGLDLFTVSEQKEPVKYGLSIIEVFAAENMPVPLKDLIRISAMYHEFTPFAVPIMQRWNYSEQILDGLTKIVSDEAAKIILEITGKIDQ